MARAITPAGIEIWYGLEGAGPPLLLVHGTAADRTRWDPLVPYLRDHFSVAVMERRGRGASGDGDGYGIEAEFHDVAAVIGDLAQQHAGAVAVLGHSYGALCALEASRLTDRIGAMALYEPPIPTGGPTGGPITPPAVLEAIEKLGAAGDREGVLTAFCRQVVHYPDEELEMFRAAPTWANRVAAAHTIPRELRALNSGYTFQPGRFADLGVPTLLLLGGDSPPFLKQATGLLAKTLPNARLEILEGQRHNAFDQIREAFAALVIDFLAEA